jgi:hypothetical protein
VAKLLENQGNGKEWRAGGEGVTGLFHRFG